MTESELQEVAEAWIKVQHGRENENGPNFWAHMRVAELCRDDPEACWDAVHKIRTLDGSDAILANLAAGPIEDLFAEHGERFIERAEALAKSDSQFKKILGAVWDREDMPQAVWCRIKAVAGPSW